METLLLITQMFLKWFVIVLLILSVLPDSKIVVIGNFFTKVIKELKIDKIIEFLLKYFNDKDS